LSRKENRKLAAEGYGRRKKKKKKKATRSGSFNTYLQSERVVHLWHLPRSRSLFSC
jgi:hypothetical protein